MPTYNSTLTYLDVQETRRYAGIAKHTDFSTDLLNAACSEALALAKPKGIWQIYEYDPDNAMILSPQPLLLSGNKIITHLSSSTKVAIMAVTIGELLEQEVTIHFTNGTYSAGLLLDAAGTTAVEATADSVNHLIQHQAALEGYTALSRFSPGYGDWDITVQPHILDLAEAAQIGITVTNSCMLVPRKSITAIIGLTPQQAHLPLLPVCHDIPCTECPQINCLAKKNI